MEVAENAFYTVNYRTKGLEDRLFWPLSSSLFLAVFCFPLWWGEDFCIILLKSGNGRIPPKFRSVSSETPGGQLRVQRIVNTIWTGRGVVLWIFSFSQGFSRGGFSQNSPPISAHPKHCRVPASGFRGPWTGIWTSYEKHWIWTSYENLHWHLDFV